MPIAAVQKPIYLGNTFLVRQALTVYDPDTNGFIPLAGGEVTCRLSAAADGSTTISGTGPFPMAEAPGAAGTYYYVYPESVVGLLAALVDTLVYLVVEAGTYDELKDVQPLLVQAARPPLLSQQ